MTRILSPSDYRAASMSRALAVQPVTRTGGPVMAYDSLGDMNDPRLIEFLRDGEANATGTSVNAHVALRNSTFFRAVCLIASAVGMLPLHLMQQDADGGNKRKARQHPLFRVLHKKPNGYQTALEFKAYLQTLALLDGNAYAYIVRSGRRVLGLVPFKRHTITPRQTPDLLDIVFDYDPPNGGGRKTLTSRDVFHFRHPVTLDGIHGLALLRFARETIGIASVAQRAAARMFKNGAFAPGVLETPKTLGDAAHQRVRNDWEELHSGADNAGKWPILEEGLTARNLSPNAKEAQHLETRQHEAEEIARFTGAPRPLLMFDETSWGSGIEQLGQMFVTYCLMPWFVSWEQAVERVLEPDEEDLFYAKFNAAALLRGTPKDQAEFFAKALGSGGSAAWETPNEVRDAFDMNPVPGGDELPPRAGNGSGANPDPAPAPAPPPPPRKKKED